MVEVYIHYQWSLWFSIDYLGEVIDPGNYLFVLLEIE